MQTILIAGHFASLAAFCEYANSLVGDELADYFEGYTVSQVKQFQVLPALEGIDAVLLVEVERITGADESEGSHR